ncbi:MAG: hypothetical protein K2X64_05525, partial [Rhodocyclaceae bacterium]|nr:hypothetical protein [Rhodocyclaceae bacterium]
MTDTATTNKPTDDIAAKFLHAFGQPLLPYQLHMLKQWLRPMRMPAISIDLARRPDRTVLLV